MVIYYGILKECFDTDGTMYAECEPRLYKTEQQAKEKIVELLKEELETLGDSYEINDYDMKLVNDIGDAIIRYNIYPFTI